MSEAHALLFLEAARGDEAIRARLADRPGPGTDDLAAIAAERGWTFDTADLARAFRHDWTMRWIYFSRRSGSGARA